MVTWGEARCRTQWEHNDLGMPRNDRLRRSLLEFQERFPDREACAADLSRLHWPAGFVCPACGSSRGWALATKAHTHECADCRKWTSVMAGTVMHSSKLALTAWFSAAYPMTTHSKGISALQQRKQFGLGSHKTAWLLTTWLRQNMVAPQRMPLEGLVEADESVRQSHQGKLLVAGAAETSEGGPGRVRLRGSRTSPPTACMPTWAPTNSGIEPQVMNSHIGQAGAHPDASPRVPEIGEMGTRLPARDHPGIVLVARQGLRRRSMRYVFLGS